jgi:hypothetical protein
MSKEGPIWTKEKQLAAQRSWYLRNRSKAIESARLRRRRRMESDPSFAEFERKRSRDKMRRVPKVKRQQWARTSYLSRKQNGTLWAQKFPEFARAYQRKWMADRNYNRNQSRTMADSYVKNLLKCGQFATELIDVKKAHLLLLRELRNIKRTKP